MAQFNLERSDQFKADYKAKRPGIQDELNNVLRFLHAAGPSHPSLNSHPIQDKRAKREEGVRVWESYITWSHRVTWHFKPGFIIYLRATNGHEILPPKK